MPTSPLKSYASADLPRSWRTRARKIFSIAVAKIYTPDKRKPIFRVSLKYNFDLGKFSFEIVANDFSLSTPSPLYPSHSIVFLKLALRNYLPRHLAKVRKRVNEICRACCLDFRTLGTKKYPGALLRNEKSSHRIHASINDKIGKAFFFRIEFPSLIRSFMPC